MCISIGGLGAYFYLQDQDKLNNTHTVDDYGYLPLICIIVFIIAFSLGFGPLAWAMNVELYPRENSLRAYVLSAVLWH